MRNFLLIFVLLTANSGLAQNKPKAMLFYEPERQVHCDEFQVIVDSFFIELFNMPSSHGYFVLTGGNEFLQDKINYEMMFDGYINQRRYDRGRVTTVRGAETGNVKFQMWVVPVGADIPKFETVKWNFKLPAGTKPFVIHSDMVQNCSLPFSKFMNEFLAADPDTRVHIVIYANSARSRRRRVRETFPVMIGIPANRRRYFFVRSSDPYLNADYWIVPKER